MVPFLYHLNAGYQVTEPFELLGTLQVSHGFREGIGRGEQLHAGYGPEVAQSTVGTPGGGEKDIRVEKEAVHSRYLGEKAAREG